MICFLHSSYDFRIISFIILYILMYSRRRHIKVSGGSPACQIGPRCKMDKKFCSRVMTGEGKIVEGKRLSGEVASGLSVYTALLGT